MQTREPSGLKGAQDTGPRSVKDTPQPCSSLLQCFTDSCLWKHSIQGMSIWNIPCEPSIPTGKVTIILANMVRSYVMQLDLFGEWCQESMDHGLRGLDCRSPSAIYQLCDLRPALSGSASQLPSPRLKDLCVLSDQ